MTTEQTNGASSPSFSSAELERFEAWWEAHGQHCRAGGGEYEKTFAFRAWEAATKAEREACATLVGCVGDDWEQAGDMIKVWACDYLEDAIRGRSNS